MSALEWFAAVSIGLVAVIWQLSRIGARLSCLTATLQSIDAELFHRAQEQNPSYGVCDKCGRRAIVSHVVPKGATVGVDAPETFYCRGCWWMSDLVELGDAGKHYKDRPSERDRWAATVGPG